MKLPPSDKFLGKTRKFPVVATRDRVALIRRANELYNQGEMELAQRIYESIHYPDGLLRMGMKHEEDGNLIEALRLYTLCGQTARSEKISKKLAQGIRYLLKSDRFRDLGSNQED